MWLDALQYRTAGKSMWTIFGKLRKTVVVYCLWLVDEELPMAPVGASQGGGGGRGVVSGSICSPHPPICLQFALHLGWSHLFYVVFVVFLNTVKVYAWSRNFLTSNSSWILREFSFQEEIPEEDTTRILPVPFRMFFNIYCAAVFECGNKGWKMKGEWGILRWSSTFKKLISFSRHVS